MAKNNFLNPQILPSTRDIRPQDHHKIINGALLAAFVALVIGFAYWWGNKEKEVVPVVPVVTDTSYREEVILRVNQTPETQPSAAEIDQIINKVNAPPETTPSAEEKALIIERVNSGN
jgi:hypothetical protein